MIFLYLFFIFQTDARLRVVTTTSDLAWAVERLGKDRVQVESLIHGEVDPHYVEAMPHWIIKVSKADIFCMVGLDLEVGWAYRVLSRSGNKKVQPGGKGFCDASKKVSALEVPSGKINRSMGDIHPGGNPHYHLGPDHFLQAVKEIFDILIKSDPEGTPFYNKNLIFFKNEIKRLKNEVGKILKPIQKKKYMSYHKDFSYFFHDFKLISLGELEETPGVPPSAGRIARVAIEAKKNDVALMLGTKSNPQRDLDRFSEISLIPSISVFTSIRKEGKPSNYRQLILQIAHTLASKSK